MNDDVEASPPEEGDVSSVPTPPMPEPVPEATAGSLLRMARESSGLHIAALAVSMKVPVKKLEALEADRFDLLPDAVFVRALAASVCRALKVEPAPILEKLPQSSIPRLNAQDRGINAPFRAPGESAAWSMSAITSKPALLLAPALLIAALAVAFLPDTKLTEPESKLPQTGISEQAVPESANAATPAEASGTAVEVVPSGAVAPVSAPVKPDANRQAMAVGFGNSALVAFKAKGSTWVQVTDAKGVVQINKTLVEGEVVAVPALAPVSVVVGRADVTDVEVRGKPFSLTGFIKDNVARFEVK